MPLSSDPFANLATLNQVAGMLAVAARYDESLRAAERLIAAVEDSGIDFALSYGLLAKAGALIGLRRFAEAHNALGRVMARLQLGVDPWTALYLPISQARLQVSLGRLDRARDHLTLEPDSRATVGLHGEYDAHRALIEAASGNDSEAAHWITRSRRSTSIDAQSLAWLADAIRSVNCESEGGSVNLQGVDRVIESGHLDALVIACRAQPELARRITTDGTHRDTLRTILLLSADEPIARAAGLEIPRTKRRSDSLSPRELEVYELIIQGRTNPEIARSLYISEATTKVHVRHILRKLGVQSRVEAVRAWHPTVEGDSTLGDAG